MQSLHDKEAITSTRNPRIVAARKLDQRKHRQRQGRFLVEGLQLLHMALASGARPLEVFVCPEHFNGQTAPILLERFAQTEAAITPVNTHVMQTLCARDMAQGLVASFATWDMPLGAWPLPDSRALVLVLDRLQAPGNLGTLIRAADAVGAAGAILLEPGADPFDPTAVRASTGSLFTLPLARTSDVCSAFDWLRAHDLRPVGADVTNGIPWGRGLWQGGVALVLGNEARGLSPEVRACLDGCARLPMLGEAESLNVAVAGGALMYTWLHANWE